MICIDTERLTILEKLLILPTGDKCTGPLKKTYPQFMHKMCRADHQIKYCTTFYEWISSYIYIISLFCKNVHYIHKKLYSHS